MDIFQEKLQNTPKEIKSHLITLSPPKAHKSGQKNCTGCRQQDEDGVFWTWQAYCTHEFTVAVTKCTKLSQPKSEWMGEPHSVSLLAQGILAVDGYYQRESEFSSGI